MVTQLWKAWGQRNGRVRADAADLVRDHGAKAIEVATHMAQAERSGRLISPSLPRGHWNKVRREVRWLSK